MSGNNQYSWHQTQDDRITSFNIQITIMYPCVLLFVGDAAAANSLQSCPTLWDPTDGSPPDFPVPGILQARTLEWVANSFFNAWKWKVKVKSLSRVRLFATSWPVAYQTPPSMGFSRHEYWSGVPVPFPSLSCMLLLLLLLKSQQLCPTLWPQRRQPTRLPCPWDSPCKSTGLAAWEIIKSPYWSTFCGWLYSAFSCYR